MNHIENHIEKDPTRPCITQSHKLLQSLLSAVPIVAQCQLRVAANASYTSQQAYFAAATPSNQQHSPGNMRQPANHRTRACHKVLYHSATAI